MSSRTISYLGVAGLLGTAAVALNLMWLVTSTVRIENSGPIAIREVAYRACGRTHSVGTLGPNQSTFRLLEACGDDTLTVLVGLGEFCQTYVEGELYHVDVSIDSGSEVRCVDDGPLSGLFVLKALM